MSNRALFALASVLVAVAVAVIGCPQSAAGPTYHRDIAPLFAERCAQCHQDGGIGPFPLITYDDVVAHKDEVGFAVSSRLMPPSNVDASGTCRKYQDSRWLSDDEVQTVVDWVAADAPEGDREPTEPKLPALDVLDDANFFVEMPVEYTPQGTAEHENDDYRCFLLDGPEADAYVTGFEILPGEPREVHHMLLVGSLDAQTDQQAQQSDDADPRPGFECFANFATAGNINFLAGWAPGKDVVRYPDQTGLFIAGGHKLIMQVHYNLLGGPGLPDVTALKLRTAPSVPKEASVFPIADESLDVPPGQRAGIYKFSIPLAGITDDLDVYGVFPHMHQLGQTLHFELQPLGDNDPAKAFCMTDVWRWDFHWQQLFIYDQPIRMKASDVLNVSCTYNTMGRTSDVMWGEGTQDEMCLVGIYVARPHGGSLDALFP